MNHSFDVDTAVKHGVHAAVLHQTIVFWVLKNKANGKHLHDGRHWTYNSAKAFTELFPYLSADQIQRNLKKLEEAGLVTTGCFNSSPYDRTRWYSTAEGIVTDSADLRNEFPQDRGVSVYSSNQFKPVQTPKGECVEGFANFWKSYPKKVGKDAAETAWKRKVKSPETIKAILEAVKTQAQSDAWKKDGGQFVPNPATWLNQGRWKDDPAAASCSPSMWAGVI